MSINPIPFRILLYSIEKDSACITMHMVENEVCSRSYPVLEHETVHSPWLIGARGRCPISPGKIGRSSPILTNPCNSSQTSPVPQLFVKGAIPAAGSAASRYPPH